MLQNGFRGPNNHSSNSGRTVSSRDDATRDSDDVWGTAADLSVQSQSKSEATPSTATPSAAIFLPLVQRSPQTGSARALRAGRGGGAVPSPPQERQHDSSALIPAGAAAAGDSGSDGGSSSEQHTRILPSPCADPNGPHARPSPDIIMRGLSTASAEEMAAAMDVGGGMEPVGPPVPGASVDDRLNRLCRQLDTLMRHKIPVLGEYLLLGMDARRQGGASPSPPPPPPPSPCRQNPHNFTPGLCFHPGHRRHALASSILAAVMRQSCGWVGALCTCVSGCTGAATISLQQWVTAFTEAQPQHRGWGGRQDALLQATPPVRVCGNF